MSSRLRLRGHSREPLSLTIKLQPRLSATEKHLDAWIEARRIVERARQDDRYARLGLACIHHARTTVRAELPMNDPALL